jgi:hypothetical protein
MRFAAPFAMLLVLGAAGPGLAVEETAKGFSAAMQGCWNRASIEDGSNQMCLDGSVAGVLALLECRNHGDLTECSTQEGTYEFRDEKFWRSYGEGGWLTGGVDNCDVRFGPGEKFELHNCQWTTAPDSGRATEDAVYEKAIGQ